MSPLSHAASWLFALVVGGAVKAPGEVTGSDTIQGAAKRTGNEMAAQLRTAAEERGWI
jgi:hypothetical protein